MVWKRPGELASIMAEYMLTYRYANVKLGTPPAQCRVRTDFCCPLVDGHGFIDLHLERVSFGEGIMANARHLP